MSPCIAQRGAVQQATDRPIERTVRQTSSHVIFFRVIWTARRSSLALCRTAVSICDYGKWKLDDVAVVPDRLHTLLLKGAKHKPKSKNSIAFHFIANRNVNWEGESERVRDSETSPVTQKRWRRQAAITAILYWTWYPLSEFWVQLLHFVMHYWFILYTPWQANVNGLTRRR